MDASQIKIPKDLPTFRISSSSQGFEDRQRNIFDRLTQLETSHKSTVKKDRADSPELCEETEEPVPCKKFKGASSLTPMPALECVSSDSKSSVSSVVFKCPANPTSKIRKRAAEIPDYQLNPHKWTKYSLADVPNESLTEKGNMMAAAKFLEEVAQSKIASDGNEADMNASSSKIIFQKPKKNVTAAISPPVGDTGIISENEVAVTESVEDLEAEGAKKAMYCNGAFTMPEYVVGQKVKKKRGKERVKTSNEKEVKLDHLYQEDD